METLNICESKTKLSQPVERAAEGEESIIAKAGKPMARLMPLAEPAREVKFGSLAGQAWWVGDNFDDPVPDEPLAAFNCETPLRLLPDTSIFIWVNLTLERPSPSVQKLLANPENDRLSSSASVWELAIKNGTERLHCPLNQIDQIICNVVASTLPISNSYCLAAGALARHDHDRLDRMLAAQAQTDGLFLVAVDPALSRYDVPRISD